MLHTAACLASFPGLLDRQFLITCSIFEYCKTGGVEGLGTRLCLPGPRTPSTTELSGIHVANKTQLPSLLASLCILGVLSFTRSANLVHCFILARKAHQSPYRTGVLFLPILVALIKERQLAGLSRSFCSSVCVDNNTRMRKSGEECRAALPSTQTEEPKNGVGLGTRLEDNCLPKKAQWAAQSGISIARFTAQSRD